MITKVKLKDLIDEMSFQLDETTMFLKVNTGEIVPVTDQQFRDAEEYDSLDELPEWQQEELQDAYDILENSENYHQLPTKFDLNEYRIMEDFCYSVKDQHKQAALLRNIKGSGAFRRFKNQISIFLMEEQWYAYRDARYREVAIEWCQERGVVFDE